jgi:hypothetical protein
MNQMSARVQRLGKNANGYNGVTINIAAVLDDCVASGRARGWTIEELPAGPDRNLLALTRGASPMTHQRLRATDHDSRSTSQPPRIYISAGIHGDEPAGPLAVRQLLKEDLWPAEADLFLCPCLNPTGFALNRRENAEGVDLNRDYLEPKAPETFAHIAWLNRQPAFDLCLCLHEDWESHGFYCYEVNPDKQPSLAKQIVERVAQVCPIDMSEVIEERAAKNGIISPKLDPRSRPKWPEAFYLIMNKTRLSYTMEAPSDFPLQVRVNALVASVRAALSGRRSPVA